MVATTRFRAMSTRAIEPSFVSGTQTVEDVDGRDTCAPADR